MLRSRVATPLIQAFVNSSILFRTPCCQHGYGLAAATTTLTQLVQRLHVSHHQYQTPGNSKMMKKIMNPPQPKKWAKYNEIVYPPTPAGEPKRPAEVTHFRANVKYSPKKMWYICHMVRGLSIDEAVKQLSFVRRKGGQVLKEVMLEAQEMAVRDHNVEFKSNLWVADCFVGKSMIIKGIRKHRGPRYGTIHYRYIHVFVRLREGKPPKHYWEPDMTGNEYFEEYIDELRSRKIKFGL